jgi:hypothetical protein
MLLRVNQAAFGSSPGNSLGPGFSCARTESDYEFGLDRILDGLERMAYR